MKLKPIYACVNFGFLTDGEIKKINDHYQNQVDEWLASRLDLKYDAEKLQAEAQTFIDKFRSRMKDIADETLGELYANIMPYVETDTWTNYRESLRLELEHQYKYSRFKDEWAIDFRRAVFVENRDEISKLIEQDILKRIKLLEDCRQEYEQFRYTPLGDTYQDLKRDNELLRAQLAAAVEQLEIAKEPLQIAQGILTALNIGAIQSESALHIGLRKTMIKYRENIVASLSEK